MFWKLCQHRKYHALAEPPCNRLESHGLPNSAPGDSVVLREAQLNSGLSAKKSYHATIAIADGDLASGLSFKLDMLEVQIILGFPKILQSPCREACIQQYQSASRGVSGPHANQSERGHPARCTT